MPEQWTGEIVGKMHTHKVTGIELAGKLGVTPEYVSMILNEKKTPKGAEERFNTALDEMIAAKAE